MGGGGSEDEEDSSEAGVDEGVLRADGNVEPVRDSSGASGEAGDLEAAEETHPVRAVRAPQMPTQQEIDLHRVSHLPYRSWCPECVEAFAREWAHRDKDEERIIPLISCDYMYITENGIFGRAELSEEERQAAARVLVMYCGKTKVPFADGVPRKGADAEGHVVDCMRQ